VIHQPDQEEFKVIKELKVLLETLFLLIKELMDQEEFKEL
jgi:hypothetical protein